MNRCDGCDYEFGPFHIDREKRLLLRDGKPVSLVPKSFDMLLALVQHRGEVLEKDRLLKMLWPDSIVEEANLPQNISALRKALGEGPSERRYIETVPRRGYRFLASVREVRNEGPELIEHDPAESGAVLAKDELKQPPPANTIMVNRWFWPAAVLVLALGFAVWFGLFRTSPRSSLPLVRTFPVTSFPGQEKWPAFSPDGNQIAFAWEGERRDNFDIYVKLIGTGEPLRLTQHPGLDVCPAWSPDGQTIAFIRAYQGQVNLLSVPALGGAERTLIPLNFKGDWYGQYPTLSWSPDGKLIAFPDRHPERMVSSIHLLSVESLENRQLTTPPEGYSGDLYVAFSPDGKNLAFTRYGSEGAADVYVVSVGGGQPRRLTSDQRQVPGLAWMPDGKSIVFSSTRGGSLRMWRIALEGGTPELLSFGGDNPVPGTLRPFAISRLARRLAYVKTSEDTNIWRFEVPRGTQPVSPPVKLIASTQHETGPQFSPDGKKITFESHRSGEYEIWVCGADGSNPLQLTSFGGPMVGTPRWSPDGTRIAFDARLKGHADICTIPASGGAIRRVTDDPSNEVVPSWSNDGRWIYFASNRGKQIQVWKIPAGGGKARQVTRNGGFAAFESGDGQFLYYAKMTDSGIWRMPVNGGDEALVADVIEPGRWGYWAVAPKGIYFVNLDSPRNHTIDFFDFSTKKIKTIASLTEQFNTEAADSALAVSPDGRWILYTQLDQAESDIMLVENFR